MTRPSRKLRNPIFAVLIATLVASLVLTLAAEGAKGAGTSSGKQYFPIVNRNFKTGQGTVTGTVYDSQSGDELEGVDICFEDDNCDTTNQNGVYTLNNVPHGFQPIDATLFTYSNLQQFALVRANQTTTLDFVMSAELFTGQFRIVVTWGSNPQDMDAHLWTADDMHVYWGNRGVCPPGVVTTACLDRDDQNGKGPETITIFEAEPIPGKFTFHYGVLDYSFQIGAGNPLDKSGARVQVYSSSGLIGDFNVPSTPTSGDPSIHDFWYVFELNAQSEILTVHNCFTVEPGTGTPVCP